MTGSSHAYTAWLLRLLLAAPLIYASVAFGTRGVFRTFAATVGRRCEQVGSRHLDTPNTGLHSAAPHGRSEPQVTRRAGRRGPPASGAGSVVIREAFLVVAQHLKDAAIGDPIGTALADHPLQFDP